MEKTDIEEEEDYSFKIFTILFDFYLFGKKIEKSIEDPMLIQEFYFIDLDWLKNFKKKFDFESLEKILNLHFQIDHTFKFNQNNKDDKLENLFSKLKSEYNYHLNVTENDFKSVKIIRNENIEKIEPNYIAQRNYAIVNSKIINDLKDNMFLIDTMPKYDVYIGYKNLVFENPNQIYNNCLQCIVCKDYDSFTYEYVINFQNKEYLDKCKDIITSRTLKYFFDEKNIKMDDIIEQKLIEHIEHISNEKTSKIINIQIGTVYNLNKENLMNRSLQLEQTIIKYNKSINNNNKNIFNNSYMNGVQNQNSISINYNISNKFEYKTLAISHNEHLPKINYFNNVGIKEVGLKNFSNSCYINVVLQCLIHTKQLVIYFLKRNNIFDLNREPISFAFNSLLKHFYVQQNSNNDNLDLLSDLTILCHFVNIINNNFSPFFPNDAKDFLIFFIGRIHEELNVPNNKPYNIIDQNDPLSSFITYFTRNYNSIISHVFNWTNQIRRKCSFCDTQIFSYQTFPYLILDLEKTRRRIFMAEMAKYHQSKIDNQSWQNQYYHNRENIPINLTDCVQYYCTFQNEFNFLCPLCKRDCKQTTVNKIYLSPNIFIFILNRGKNNIFSVKMNYPPELDLSPFIEGVNSPTRYELTGVITHLGVSGPNGHFIAFCKNPKNEKWYKYNDDQVTEADNFEVHNEGIAYILFYNSKKSNKGNMINQK